MQVSYEWHIFVFAGTSVEDCITLRRRRGSIELSQKVRSQFRPVSKTNPNIDVCLDSFIKSLMRPFKIDRDHVRREVMNIEAQFNY